MGRLAAIVLGWWALGSGAAAARGPVGLWLTEDKGGVVRVEPCGAALCGVIVGLSEFPASGVKLDVHGRDQCHLRLLDGLVERGDGRWHGTVTNPEDGRAYSAEVWVPADGVLRLRGYVGLPLFGFDAALAGLLWGVEGGLQVQVRKEGLLFREKEAKSFCPGAGETAVPRLGATGAKVFWFFFSKKNCFLPYVLAANSPAFSTAPDRCANFARGGSSFGDLAMAYHCWLG